MSILEGNALHRAVACRIIERYLPVQGVSDARRVADADARGVDLEGSIASGPVRVKVQADPYCGTDPIKIADRSLPWYRRQGDDYAFEAVSHAVTRRPGWVFTSEATQLYYYFLALGQPASEIAALMNEPADVFFSELRVDRDDLHIIAMDALRAWFEEHYEQYTPRPVLVADHSAWFRLVPRDVLRAAVPVRVVGPVFAAVARP